MKYEDYLIGVIIGVVLTIILLGILLPEPFFIDCGCGAQSAMCMQCIEGGNLSADICSWFENR